MQRDLSQIILNDALKKVKNMLDIFNEWSLENPWQKLLFNMSGISLHEY